MYSKPCRQLVLLAIMVIGIMATGQEIEPDDTRPELEAFRYVGLATNMTAGLHRNMDMSLFHNRFIGEINGSELQLRLRYGFSESFGVAVRYFGYFRGDTPERPNPYDHRIRIEAILNIPLLGKLTLHQRFRLERRWRDLPNEWRLRPTSRIDYPITIGQQEFLLFSFVEIFFNARERIIGSINPAVGISTNPTEGLTVGLWLEHGEAYRDRRNSNRLQLSFTYRFGHPWHPGEPEQQRVH